MQRSRWFRANQREEAYQWIGPDGGAFVQLANAWREAGASWIGGCCGTGPDDIARLRERLAA